MFHAPTNTPSARRRANLSQRSRPVEQCDYPYFQRRLRDRQSALLDVLSLMLQKIDSECYARIRNCADGLEPRALAALLLEPNAATIRNIRQLDDIESALQRLARNTYAKCLQCGSAMTRDLLSVHPTAQFCTACQPQGIPAESGGRDE